MKKVFVIGMNKTGTTSMEKTLKELGYKMCPQSLGESITLDYINGNLNSLYTLVDSYEAFQDHPFSISGIHIPLFNRYPKSKFILTIRSTPEVWYNSVVKFHTKMFSTNKKNPPTYQDLLNSNYHGKGWMYKIMKHKFNTPDQNIYLKHKLIAKYNQHYFDIISFFKNKPNSLLVLDISQEDSYMKLCKFLNKKCDENKKFPHLNKS